MPPSKKKRGRRSQGQLAGGGQLLNAVREGDTAGVTRLLAAGADPNASVAQRTPSGAVLRSTVLCAAVQHGRLEAVQLLLDAGADPSRASSDGDGATALMAAAGYGQPEVLRLLLARGAAVDAVDPGDGTTAFHWACVNNSADCAEALVRAGCDVGTKDKLGETGRERAEAMGNEAVAAGAANELFSVITRTSHIEAQ
jgi:ankyrin repeat protein